MTQTPEARRPAGPEVRLVPIEAPGSIDDPLPLTDYVREMCRLTVEWYGRGGFQPPWISYLVQCDELWVGCCGYKGAPRDGRVEIAYHTFPAFEGRGVGTAVAAAMVRLALETDPQLLVTAQTLPAESASTALLRKNGFVFARTVDHPEDGLVWEWEYRS